MDMLQERDPEGGPEKDGRVIQGLCHFPFIVCTACGSYICKNCNSYLGEL